MIQKYRRFLYWIGQINFPEETARALQQVLFQEQISALETEQQRLQTQIEQIADISQASKPSQEPLSNQIKVIEDELEKLRKKKPSDSPAQASGSQENALENPLENPAFIQNFADNFRNIQHLTTVLADAPASIKALQTRFFAQILTNLTFEEQEAQLNVLTNAELREIIEQAAKTYDETNDETRKHEAQTIAHMALFRLIAPQLDQSLEEVSLTSLTHQIPDVRASSILDRFSDYQNTRGQTIGHYLKPLLKTIDWEKEGAIQKSLELNAFLHRLRFGQDDRREYIQKRQENMKRDLFWARDIRDIELLTKSSESSDLFKAQAENRFFSRDNCPLLKVKASNNTQISDANLTNNTLKRSVAQGCAIAFDKFLNTKSQSQSQAQKTYKEILKNLTPQSPRKNLHNSLLEALQNELTNSMENPEIAFDPKSKNITINFIYCSNLKNTAQKMLKSHQSGTNSNTLLIQIDQREVETSDSSSKEDPPFFSHLHNHSFTGSSLKEIRDQIIANQNIDKAVKAHYEAVLTQIENEIKRTEPTEIQDLNLNNPDELTLRKLLELNLAHEAQLLDSDKPYFHKLSEAFNCLKDSGPQKALEIQDLALSIEPAYQDLAIIPTNTFKNEKLKPIIERARIIRNSTQERQKKRQQLEAILVDKGLSQDARSVQITELFCAEYHEMQDTLWPGQDASKPLENEGPSGLHDVQPIEIKPFIQGMAEDISKLIERTNQGQPALTEDEQKHYFQVIHAIASQLNQQGISIGNVTFKIPHSFTGKEITVYQGDRKIPLQLDLPGNISLPYSLIKPPGEESEFIFSYGGTRGVIAPFAEFEAVYKKSKGRYFTHSRLLGVGQYGAAKEVEGVLTGLNQVLKTGLISEQTDPYNEPQRLDLKTRPVTSKPDPLYRIESDLLQALTLAEQAQNDDLQQGTHYWVDEKKKTKAHVPLKQYYILSERAKGETYADTANQSLSQYSKSDPAYHNPLERTQSYEEIVRELNERLALSQATVAEAKRFDALGLTHNDIKPENFLYKRRDDGQFEVKYIDWATGAFIRDCPEPSINSSANQFKACFGTESNESLPNKKIKDMKQIVSDGQGRFAGTKQDKFQYGVIANLGIFTEARNGTLPYISPKVLNEDVTKKNGITEILPGETYMDDWALTAMTFGICNRQAYFKLAKGRTVSDYVVPGIIEIDQDISDQGELKIVDFDKFNRYFSCRDEDFVNDPKGEDPPNAVMFIPGNTREGEPFHLYRRLEWIKKNLTDNAPKRAQFGQIIIQDIDDILNQVHTAVKEGRGLSKEDLQATLGKAQACMQAFQASQAQQEAVRQADVLEKVLGEHYQDSTELETRITEGGEPVSKLEILCTYPRSPETQAQASGILEAALNEESIIDKLFQADSPYRHLLNNAIQTRQSLILKGLFKQITTPNHQQTVLEHIKQFGLLHQAMEQSLPEVAGIIVETLERLGLQSDGIFKLMTEKYGPEASTSIHWNTNAFHIAIRNHDEALLTLILKHLPENSASCKTEIENALHLSAVFGNTVFFQRILNKYNEKYEEKLTLDKVLAIECPPDETSPYHLFLRDPSCLTGISWGALRAGDIGKQFLLKPRGPEDAQTYPLLIAAENRNGDGVQQLFELADSVGLSQGNWAALVLQTDAEGKNLLNHILEQNQLDQVKVLLEKIKNSLDNPQDTVFKLLSTPHPLNPLRNYLENTHPPTGETFEIIKALLDGVCKTFNSENSPAQEQRVTLLLANQHWLIQQAEKQENHAQLTGLIKNEALSVGFRRRLLTELEAFSHENSEAKTFYQTLLNEVREEPDSEIAYSQVLVQFPDISVNIATLNADNRILNEALQKAEEQNRALAHEIEELISTHEHTLESLNMNHQAERTQLQEDFEAQENSLTKMLDELKSKLKDEKDLSKELSQQFGEKQKEFSNLEHKIAALESSLQDAQEGSKKLFDEKEEMKLSLDTLKKEHEENERLKTELEKAFSQLEDQSLLEERINELSTENKELSDRLQHEYLEKQVLHQKNITLREENLKIESDLQNLNTQASEQTLSIAKLEQQLKQNQQGMVDAAQLQDKIRELDAELEEILEKLNALQNERKEIASELDAQKAINLEQTHTNSQLVAENAYLTEQLASKQSPSIPAFDPTQQNQAIQQLTEEVTRLQNRVQELEASAQQRVEPDKPVEPAEPVEPVEEAAQPQEAPPPENSQSHYKIFAQLSRHKANEPAPYTIAQLFPESDEEEPIITINFPEEAALTPEDIKQFVSQKGLNVTSPSGQQYAMGYDEATRIPKAVLTKGGLHKLGGETPKQSDQRLAVTIMNMIDNILTQSRIVKVNTRDPFIAAIAEQYIKHLKDNVEIGITDYEITGCDSSQDNERTQAAKQVYNKIQGQVTKEILEQRRAQWITAVKEKPGFSPGNR